MLVIGAFALGGWLRNFAEAGIDVSDRIDTAAIARAPGYPSDGPAQARVTLVVFSDYACPVCRATEPALAAAVRADGNTRVIYRDWPIFGAASRRAALVALAAARHGIHAPVHAALMRAPNLGDAELRRAVEQAGGDWAAITVDMAAHRREDAALLARTAEDAMRLGLPGTPGYLVGPLRIVGKTSERQFRRAIARARGT